MRRCSARVTDDDSCQSILGAFISAALTTPSSLVESSSKGDELELGVLWWTSDMSDLWLENGLGSSGCWLVDMLGMTFPPQNELLLSEETGGMRNGKVNRRGSWRARKVEELRRFKLAV